MQVLIGIKLLVLGQPMHAAAVTHKNLMVS